MDIAFVFEFLRELAANNNREWFHAHKPEYERARLEFEELLAAVIARISTFDESIRYVEPRQCTYRIYRDTRFSADKAPYKIHLGGYINARGKKSDHCGYYLHLQPEGSMLAGGCYCPSPALLKVLRQAIADNMDEYRSIVEDPSFRQYFPVVGESFLKTAPKGFSRDYPFLKYVQCKDFLVSYPLPDDFFLSADSLDRTEAVFRQLKRFSDFLNEIIDAFIEDSLMK